jgi:hypothetical protein
MLFAIRCEYADDDPGVRVHRCTKGTFSTPPSGITTLLNAGIALVPPFSACDGFGDGVRGC